MFPAKTCPRPLFVAALLIGLGFGYCWEGPTHAPRSEQATATSPAWRDVSLPFRPVHITSNGGVVWVCGADEMVAKSEDGGRSWTVKHEKSGGAALLTLAFAGDETIFASGTNGIMLRSDDGGETWKSSASGSETVISASFGDTAHGIRRTTSAVEITSDRGQNWKAVVDPNLRTFPQIMGIAALDGTHYSIVSMRQVGKTIFLTTDDGGATWKAIQPKETWWFEAILTYGGEWWAFGNAQKDDRNPSEYVGQLVAHSPDGMNWSRDANAPDVTSDCRIQGCILYDGAIQSLFDRVPSYIAFPTGKPLTPEWAIAEGKICTISRALFCAAASSSVERPPVPHGPTVFDLGASPDTPVRGCLFCPLYAFSFPKALLKPRTVVPQITGPGSEPLQLPPMSMLHLGANLDVSYQLEKDGTTKNVEVRGTEVKEIQDAVRADVESWLFQPPGTGLSKHQQLGLFVRCSGSPSREDASCLAQLPPRPSTRQ